MSLLKKIKNLLALLLLSFAVSTQSMACLSSANQPYNLATDTVIPKEGKLLYSDNFDKDTDQWFSEFEIPENSTLTIKNSKLDLVAKKGATAWFKTKLSGNYIITYDEVVVNEGGPCDRVSDMNLFWNATNPSGLFFNLDGKFPSYDLLHLYYAGIGGNNNSTTRFRKYTGVLADKAVIKEYTDSAHLIEGNKLYKIKIIVNEGRSMLFVNGELYFDNTDEAPYKEGYFAFRTTRSHQQFDNFKIYSIKK